MLENSPDDRKQALSLHRAGQLGPARAAYEALLADAPGDADLLGLAGVLALQEERTGDAEALFRRSLVAGGEARTHLRNLNNYLVLLIQAQRDEDARALVGGDLPEWPEGAAPDAAERGTVLSLVKALIGYGQPEKGRRLLERALPERSGDATALNLDGRLRLYEGDADAAAEIMERAAELAPGNAEVQNNLGNALNEVGRHDEAIASLTKALQLRPDFVEAHTNLGIALAALGKSDEAIANYSRVLELKPDYVRAYYLLARTHRFQPRDPLIKELNRQLARQPRDGGERIFLLEALGKAHDDLRLYDKAFSYYRKANQESAKRVSFDQAAQRARFEAIKSAFPQPLLCPDRSPGAVIPIFVVGMSRAGKTLVESLLAQHPAVISAGESREWLRALDRVLEKSGITNTFPARLGSLTSAQICEVGEHYLHEHRRRRRLPGGRFYINTLPGHYRHLGLIFRAFPSVKVIYCQREPLDQCLSIYFKFFANGNEHSYDLEDLAAYYVNYQDMMAHWMRLYGERILTVQYETLVREPLEVGRGLYAHCGLDFPPAMFHADFRTDQIGHARHYEGQLAPLRAALSL